ncbi:hypothetical protein P8452_17977 [Trifolium repens]|nr:hypothetical protein P8452_17977 [Trifolium repens]
MFLRSIRVSLWKFTCICGLSLLTTKLQAENLERFSNLKLVSKLMVHANDEIEYSIVPHPAKDVAYMLS